MIIVIHTCHNLPPSEIDLGLRLAVLQAQEGDTYFTELAERVEYGNYDVVVQMHVMFCSSATLDISVCEKQYFCASPCSAGQQQKLLSSH